jgi:hypothetical protein
MLDGAMVPSNFLESASLGDQLSLSAKRSPREEPRPFEDRADRITGAH